MDDTTATSRHIASRETTDLTSLGLAAAALAVELDTGGEAVQDHGLVMAAVEDPDVWQSITD